MSARESSGDGSVDEPIYAFDITLHGLESREGGLPPGGSYDDGRGAWPTVLVPREWLAEPMAIGFDEAFTRLQCLERMYVEPDGSFVWASPREGAWWQVDGNASEREGRILLVDLKGSCPPSEFDRLLASFGGPQQAFIMQLVRPAVFLDEQTFRRHAACRGLAGDGRELRPG